MIKSNLINHDRLFTLGDTYAPLPPKNKYYRGCPFTFSPHNHHAVDDFNDTAMATFRQLKHTPYPPYYLVVNLKKYTVFMTHERGAEQIDRTSCSKGMSDMSENKLLTGCAVTLGPGLSSNQYMPALFLGVPMFLIKCVQCVHVNQFALQDLE